MPRRRPDAILAFTDGACSGNPGPAGIGVVLVCGNRRKEISDYIVEATSNIAELTAVVRALSAIKDRDRHVILHSDSEYAIGVLIKGWKITFTRSGNAIHTWWKNTVVGSARLTPTRLVFSANSVERADALVERVRDALGGLATWKKRTHEELPPMFGGEALTIDAQVTDSPAASSGDAFRAWLDAPSPTLGGRAPREAMRDVDGPQRVHLLLKEMEHRHARKPNDDFDPSLLRRELGLDELGQPLANSELDRALGSGRKLSETLLDFARPLIDADPGRIDEHALRALLGFAINVWNLVVTDEVGGSAVDLRAELVASRAPSEMLGWLDRLVARKRERFSGDLRLVGNWRVRRSRDRLDIQMESRVPQAIHAKLTAAGLLPLTQ